MLIILFHRADVPTFVPQELLHISRNHVEVLPRITTIGQLPSKTMRKFATVAGDLLAKKENIPSATLLTCVGVLTFAHQPDQVIVLSSSPLFSEVSKYQPQTCTHITVGKSQALDVFSNWLIPIVARVIPQALKHMHALPSDGRHCYRALEGNLPYRETSFFPPNSAISRHLSRSTVRMYEGPTYKINLRRDQGEYRGMSYPLKVDLTHGH